MAFDTQQDSRRPRIGVTGNHKRLSPSWFSIRFCVWLAGGDPVRISVRHPNDLVELEGFIISGGDDIHPSLYGEEGMPKADYDQPRDELEQRVIRHALNNSLPMLGICRGYQLINVSLGGKLHSDIRKMRSKTSNFGTILPRKTAVANGDTLLSRTVSSNRFRINSLHHQAVEQPGKGLSVVAKDLDDFSQATECPERHILGVQWHPEYMMYLPRQRRLFKWLVATAAKQRTARNSAA